MGGGSSEMIALPSWLLFQNGARYGDAAAPLPASSPRLSVQVSGRDAVQRTFVFKDFNTAFSFMTRVAMAAEQVQRLPPPPPPPALL